MSRLVKISDNKYEKVGTLTNEILYEENGTTNHYKFYKQAIKSVVTKELFELAEYRIGE